MRVDVLFLPRDFSPRHAEGTVVVFDVLRATTTITSALASGATEVRIFDSLDAARSAAGSDPADRRTRGVLLCGEYRCLLPAGFDLANSPGAYTSDSVAGRMIYLATTNGTRALVAARASRHLLIGALVNAAAVARELVRLAADATLLCAGTDGEVALEDLLGCGAVIDELLKLAEVQLAADGAQIAHQLFIAARADLAGWLRATRGGQNILLAGLADDIDFCARLNAFDVVGRCDGEMLVVHRAGGSL